MAVGEVVDELRAVLPENTVGLVDVWTAVDQVAQQKKGKNDRDGLKDLLIDGIHLTGGGYKIVFEEIMKVIEKEFNELTPGALPLLWPSWEDINLGNPRESLII